MIALLIVSSVAFIALYVCGVFKLAFWLYDEFGMTAYFVSAFTLLLGVPAAIVATLVQHGVL